MVVMGRELATTEQEAQGLAERVVPVEVLLDQVKMRLGSTDHGHIMCDLSRLMLDKKQADARVQRLNRDIHLEITKVAARPLFSLPDRCLRSFPYPTPRFPSPTAAHTLTPSCTLLPMSD